MRLHLADKSSVKRPFIIGGTIIGVLGSIWYLYRNMAIPGIIPDPVWTRFVNVALIMFVAIYIANLLRRIVEFLFTKGDHSQ